MLALQGTCAAIVALYLFVRLLRAPVPAQVLRRLGLLALGSFVGEDSVIRAYGFYHYNPAFHFFVDQVPLLIVLIWPIVIDSAWELARRLVPGREGAARPLCAAGFVLLDASLIEPIAVRAGLWAWTEPGLFFVPPIGILGWALFAGSCIALLQRAEGRPFSAVAAVLLAPLCTHGLLIAVWWLALRWVSVPLPAMEAALCAWLVLLPFCLWIYRRRLRERVPPGDLLVRIPGALFFFGLLWRGAADLPLVVYALAFVPPYLALLSSGRRHLEQCRRD